MELKKLGFSDLVFLFNSYNFALFFMKRCLFVLLIAFNVLMWGCRVDKIIISTQNNYIGVNMARGKDKLIKFKEYLAVKDAETDYGVVADGPLKG